MISGIFFLWSFSPDNDPNYDFRITKGGVFETKLCITVVPFSSHHLLNIKNIILGIVIVFI